MTRSLPFLFATAMVVESPSDILTEKLTHQFTRSGFPGFCVAIIQSDKIVYQNGFGYADIQSKSPYTTDTIQPIGSVSKTFIGVALMKAIEKGYLSRETHINDVLDFNVSNPYFPDNPITLQHLATHTSGIIDREKVYEQTYQFGKRMPSISLKQFLNAYFTKMGKFYSKENFVDSKPGTSFHYSNIGATLVAYVIEAKTRMPFSDFTEKYILQPLRMNDSRWFDQMSTSSRSATLYKPGGVPYPKYVSITYPDGSMRTSCVDLSKYLVEIIKGYNGASNVLLSRNSFRIMLSPQFAATKPPSHVSEKEPNEGIFFTFRRNGLIGHTGGDYGVTAFMFFDPRTSRGKIFMTNIGIDENPTLAQQFRTIWKMLDE